MSVENPTTEQPAEAAATQQEGKKDADGCNCPRCAQAVYAEKVATKTLEILARGGDADLNGGQPCVTVHNRDDAMKVLMAAAKVVADEHYGMGLSDAIIAKIGGVVVLGGKPPHPPAPAGDAESGFKV